MRRRIRSSMRIEAGFGKNLAIGFRDGNGRLAPNSLVAFFKFDMQEEVHTCRNQSALLNALIAEMEAFDDPGEVFDTLVGLKDDVRVEDAKLMWLNDLIAHAEEEIEMKEAQLEVANGFIGNVFQGNGFSWLVVGACRLCPYGRLVLQTLLTMDALYILDKLAEVADSSRLQDKMKIVFMQARGSDESFIALMRDLCSALRVSIAKNRRLIAELEALGQRAEALKPLDYMKEIVGRDSATLGVLEQLLAGTHVGMRLKASYVAEMEETD
ncbi:hypothetical protein Tco_0813790 [Tanacetum coccineum]